MIKAFFGASFALLLFACRRPIVTTSSAETQQDSLLSVNPYVTKDVSQMDMAWCPAKYPIEKMNGNDSLKLIARIIYSRPHRKGRKIFGDSTTLCPYGKPWRLGANEATELDLMQDVSVAGKHVSKGMYVLYCVPHPDHWTIIFSSDLFTWGLRIDPRKDLFSVDVPVMPQSPSLEDFTVLFTDTNFGADLLMAWDGVKVVVPFTYNK